MNTRHGILLLATILLSVASGKALADAQPGPTSAPSAASIGVATEVRIISEGDEVCMNIYGEMPWMDTSSRYVIYVRLPGAVDADPTDRSTYRKAEVWRADLADSKTERIATGVLAIKGMAISPDHRCFYYVTSQDDGSWREIEVERLVRLDIATLERREVSLSGQGRLLTTMGTISRDGMYFAGARLGPQRYAILRIDPSDGHLKVIYEADGEIFNAHPQIEPGKSREIMIQHNRGAEVRDDGSIIRPYGKMGTTLFLMDLAGENRRSVNVGKPFSPTIQGHEAWIGKTGSILFTTHWGTLKQRAEIGNIWTIRPGDDRPRPIARGYTFWHCSASRCGRYFIADTRLGPIVPNPDAAKSDEEPYVTQDIPARGLIVVGSISTGRTRVLCASLADFAKAQHSHPHVYLSPDSKWAIFNSKTDGIPHVAAARLPDGLFEELDRP